MEENQQAMQKKYGVISLPRIDGASRVGTSEIIVICKMKTQDVNENPE